MSSRIVLWTSASVPGSTFESASSRTATSGFDSATLASETSCRSPAESGDSRSSTHRSAGHRGNDRSAPRGRGREQLCLSRHLRLRDVPIECCPRQCHGNRCPSCGSRTMRPRVLPNRASFRFTPPYETCPSSGSYIRVSIRGRVDLPAPVGPTSARVSPGRTRIFMSLRTGSPCV